VALLIACLGLASVGGAMAQPAKQSNPTGKQAAEGPYSRPSSSSVNTDDFEAAHAALLDTERMQFERPFEAVEIPTYREPPTFFKWLGDLLSALAPIFQIIFYLGAALIAGGILYFIAMQIPNIRLRQVRRKTAKTDTHDHVISTVRPDEKKVRSWLEEADALASEGKFSEAVHLLLFRSIEDIQTKRKERIPTAFTAREIEQLEGLPDRPRTALSPIIALVERSFFGGQSVDQNSWASARAAYEDFAFGEGWT